jgi:hypothetical protein
LGGVSANDRSMTARLQALAGGACKGRNPKCFAHAA